jgi:[phosphatase 2A protein]-leucine-carboxy methyltransferase
MLDEVEELNLVLQHYAITWGVKLSDVEGGASQMAGWAEWGLKPSAGYVKNDEEDESN